MFILTEKGDNPLLVVFSEQWTDHLRVQNLNTTECVWGYLDGEKKQEMVNQLLRLNGGGVSPFALFHQF